MSPLPSLEPYFGSEIFTVITLETYEKDEITDNYTDRCKTIRLVLSLEASFISTLNVFPRAVGLHLIAVCYFRCLLLWLFLRWLTETPLNTMPT